MDNLENTKRVHTTINYTLRAYSYIHVSKDKTQKQKKKERNQSLLHLTLHNFTLLLKCREFAIIKHISTSHPLCQHDLLFIYGAPHPAALHATSKTSTRQGRN